MHWSCSCYTYIVTVQTGNPLKLFYAVTPFQQQVFFHHVQSSGLSQMDMAC